MKTAFILRLALVAFVGSICPSFAQSSSSSDDSNITPQEIAARQANIRAYFKRLEEKRNIVVTKTMPDGEVIDFIPREPNQPTPPPMLQSKPFSMNGKPPVQAPLTWLQKNRALKGPAGTVPAWRFDVEGYLSHVKIPPKNVGDMIAPPHSGIAIYEPVVNADVFLYHVMAAHTLPSGALGTGAYLNEWKTYGPYPDLNYPNVIGLTHTLWELLVEGTQKLDTIEWGLTQDIGLNGDYQVDANGNQTPFLFSFFTTNNYASHGDNVGGYNLMQAGYHIFDTEVGPGCCIFNTSVYGGTQVEVYMTIWLYQGNWWVSIAGQALGYYPASIFNPASAGGIQNGASNSECYGEVCSGTTTTNANGMGSGAFPVPEDGGTQNYTHAAYIRDFGAMVIQNGAITLSPYPSVGFSQITDPGCYTTTDLNSAFTQPNNNAGLENWWYYGGPGHNGAGLGTCLP